MRTILHIDFNSFFASVEQQANPYLRGKPIGVTGGDRMERTVLGTASIEAKKRGVKTGMQIWEAKKLCPEIIIVPGDSDKYLSVTKKFLNIVKSFSPIVEVFSIDEVFMEMEDCHVSATAGLAMTIKQRIREEIGEYITCSIGISYNKLMAKLAGSLQKPDGLVVIGNEEEAIKILDKIELNEICGIGFRIKKRLNNMGIFNFRDLRNAPIEALLASFKSYGQVLYNMARGVDERPVLPFFEKEEVKSIGHRHTIDHDTSNLEEIKQLLLKLTELIARKLRAKKLVGKTVSCWFRLAHNVILNDSEGSQDLKSRDSSQTRNDKQNNPHFEGSSIQITIPYTQDGLEIFNASWKIFQKIWKNPSTPFGRSGPAVRMIGVSVSNLRPQNPMTLSLLPETNRSESIIKAIDKVNNRYGEFTLQRGVLLGSGKIKRRPNSFLSDFRFKV